MGHYPRVICFFSEAQFIRRRGTILAEQRFWCQILTPLVDCMTFNNFSPPSTVSLYLKLESTLYELHATTYSFDSQKLLVLVSLLVFSVSSHLTKWNGQQMKPKVVIFRQMVPTFKPFFSIYKKSLSTMAVIQSFILYVKTYSKA